ncbi:methionyl-tRNA formyltransferase [Leptospira bouyouniensis]|uniref:Methionyl-tRNA formyltransferase n=1 Tax=Leptospira bouyouniensis TaxID=2484911 RepID=A0A7I0HMN9_9LEPT|nr:formyltransferase family protein [Leptospira bouyouniensis]TGK48612.1 methionyl-tRNA formyltransferase [Leptospira bouyouniensis]TGL02301.1 methionyl-tRNA formyltransferase [Leptospira bouyouniensis]
MNEVIFCGFGGLGQSCLSELINFGLRVTHVLTHKELKSDSVDTLALENKIPFYYSDLRKDQILLDELKSKKVKYLISVNYRYIIPIQLLESASYPLNIHGSLLPKYRGRAPHIWAIINGENFTGVTCHIMEVTVDTGPIYSQIKIPISSDTTGNDIINEFKKIYPIVLRETLEKIKNQYLPTPQKEEDATYFGKRIPEMGYIDILKSKQSIINFVRAQTRPYPGAYYYLPTGDKIIIYKISVFNSKEFETTLTLGSIRKFNEDYLLSVSDGILMITEYEII